MNISGCFAESEVTQTILYLFETLDTQFIHFIP